jgi:hypothetical protein
MSKVNDCLVKRSCHPGTTRTHTPPTRAACRSIQRPCVWLGLGLGGRGVGGGNARQIGGGVGGESSNAARDHTTTRKTPGQGRAAQGRLAHLPTASPTLSRASATSQAHEEEQEWRTWHSKQRAAFLLAVAATASLHRVLWGDEEVMVVMMVW